jgi:hypothetical protein
MFVQKEKTFKIEKDCLFLIGKLNLNSNYFINKINQGVSQPNNNNYKTNVLGLMTSWDYFCEDEKFLKTLFPIFDKLDSYSFIKNYFLDSAWGIIEKFGERTVSHDHLPCIFSGVIYLNDHPQELIFPSINEKIKPEKGKFVLFSSDLIHLAKRNTSYKAKYAISFNLIKKLDY